MAMCINSKHGKCSNKATHEVSGVPMCDSCTVQSYPAERDGRTIVVVRR
jgi:hypothetical protein